MYKILLIIVLALFCVIPDANSQLKLVIKLKGKITDERNSPIIGATLRIKGETAATLSKSDGTFELRTTIIDGTMIISYTGYQKQEINYNEDETNFIIKLKSEDTPLNEVQVIGYGTTTKRLSTGNVSTISAKEIEQQPVQNVLAGLSGRMAGVFVQTTNGLPGGNTTIQIRGKASLIAGNNPLYIIDGVPYDGADPSATNTTISTINIGGTLSPLSNINPQDIESISVLKDADATSIYGSRGANGVVLITTKKANIGSTRFEVNVSNGVSKVSESPKLLSLVQFQNIRNEAFLNDKVIPSSNPDDPNYAPDLTVYEQTKSKDWYKYIYGNTATTTDVQSKLSGGKETLKFSISGNYHLENTILLGDSKYQRGGLVTKIQHQSDDNRFNISLSNIINHQNNIFSNIFLGIGSVFLAPNFPIKHSDGSMNWESYTNVEAAKNSTSKTITDNMITSINLDYKLFSNLNFSVNSGYTTTKYDQNLIFPSTSLYPGSINYSIFGLNTSQSFIIEPQLNFKIKSSKHGVNFLVGTTFQNLVSNNKVIQGNNYKVESLMEDLGSAGTIEERSTIYSQYKYASLFGRITYNYLDTYILNATLRRDGSSKFGPGNRFGNFGSFGFAWIFSNVSFIKNSLPFLSFGKFKASIGTTGNDQIGDYQYLSTYSSLTSNLYQGVATITPNRITNANFHWETTKKKDLSVELGFLKDRLFFSAGYYFNNSKDQLVKYAIPAITGFTYYQANLPAVIENSGFEFSINSTIKESKCFTWSTSLNLTLPKNKLKSFQNFSTSSYSKVYELGYDITRLYGYKYLGINQETGLAEYAGQDGLPSSNPYLFHTLGKQTPDYYGGLGNSIKYQNFQIDIFTQFVNQLSRGSLFGNIGALSTNNFNIILDHWSPTNPNGRFPKATLNYDSRLESSSLNIFNTSYLRIKNISLSYFLNNRVTEKLKIKKFKFYVQGQNLWTIWNKNAAVYDPESAIGNVPPLKTIIFGLQLTL